MKVRFGFAAFSSLKNRLFLAFLLLILLPYAVLHFRSVSQIERSFVEQISRQNTQQLEQLKLSFEDLRGTVFRIAVRLELDPAIADLLNGRSASGTEERRKEMEALWNEIKSKTLPSPFVYYSLIDRQSREYASYAPAKPADYEALLARPEIASLRNGKSTYVWLPDDATYLRPEDSRSTSLLTLYSLFKDSAGNEAGLIRIGIDFQAWLSSMAKSFPITQDFFLLDGQGRLLGGTGERADASRMYAFLSEDDFEAGEPYRVEGSYLYNRMPVPAMNWTLVSRFPLHVIFGDIGQVKQRMVTTFLLFTLVFVAITFGLLSRLTRPLRLLQKKMAELTKHQLLTHLPTGTYKGEVLALAQAFNKMVNDLQALMRRLKAEERQKEAVRFQMLLSQMNPHFLLNTLNLVKWNAMGKGDEQTAGICVSLGKLLETSLNEESDLIHLLEERELTEAYVSIQALRYERSFEIRWECDERLDYALVPKLSLQPLVENAILHGLSNKSREGVIWIRAYTEGERCVLEVEDNGVGWNPSSTPKPERKRKSIGLTNLKERLELLFKQEASMEIVSPAGGSRVRLVFPLLVAAPYNERGTDDVERAAR
ncbi:cache domain-containing sensor histidine kinase [Paenibacillus flagellatus]|uniref:Two-component sensor histidine kinase n=1 Tax=Paenibacillus flagellatus TaxID=2211139 RepID=A0A2V5KVS7_9BACL|nr:sensor histidine kinase [Paenibacillus flagellatus]PYI56267.1 two-component sensor histidine kinase [Paenibacillus flagellatus]